MLIPANIIANADDFGLNKPVNEAILYCFENGIINSTSIMTNRPAFEEAIGMAHANKVIKNVGLHVDFVNFKPASDFQDKNFLTDNGSWDRQKTDRTLNFFSTKTKQYFFKEIEAQIQMVLKAGVRLTHIDTHCHLHNLPCYYTIFIKAAKQYNLKLRLAHVANEGNYLKFLFRKYINKRIKDAGCAYSDTFETVNHFLSNGYPPGATVEVMLHPQINGAGMLTDHYSVTDMSNWISWLQKTNNVKV